MTLRQRPDHPPFTGTARSGDAGVDGSPNAHCYRLITVRDDAGQPATPRALHSVPPFVLIVVLLLLALLGCQVSPAIPAPAGSEPAFASSTLATASGEVAHHGVEDCGAVGTTGTVIARSGAGQPPSLPLAGVDVAAPCATTSDRALARAVAGDVEPAAAPRHGRAIILLLGVLRT